MRNIDIEVFGERVRKSSKIGGVQGENAVTTIHLTLDSTWAGYGKRVVWRDALGENPVVTVLISPLLAGSDDRLTFDFTIPSEPLAEPGVCTFTVEGYRVVDDVHVVALTVRDYLVVYPSDTAVSPVTPSAGEGEQILEALAEYEETFESIAEEAESWAVGGTGTRTGEDTDNARYYSEVAKEYADDVTEVAGEVQQAIAKINGMTASASGLAAGSSPSVSLSETGGHFAIAFGIPKGEKGDTGDTGAAGANGADGEDGTDGEDGYSPTVQISKVGRTTTITITDKNGDHTATILDGEDGQGSGDMSRAVYDADNDGVVNDSERLGNQLPSYYAAASALTEHTGSTDNPHSVTAAQVGADAYGSAAVVQGNLETHTGDTTAHVTALEKATWNAKGTYSKPEGGIPDGDIESASVWNDLISSKFDVAGGTMSGDLYFDTSYGLFFDSDASITVGESGQYDDVLLIRSLTGFVDFNSARLLRVATPSAQTDAANKQYVDTQIASAPKVATGSYVGTGTFGAGNKNSIVFSFAPKFVFISQNHDSFWISWFPGCSVFGSSSSLKRVSLSYSSNVLSWYSTVNTTGQLNDSGTTYYWIAVG